MTGQHASAEPAFSVPALPRPAPPARMVVLVHAHPDDETLTTGITMSALLRAGHRVHVLTCTLGEEGEVIPPELAHLEPSRGEGLGAWRREELRSAMAVLGVDHEVLGESGAAGESGPGSPPYRDSGMAGTPTAEHPRAFVRADVDRAAAVLRSRIVDLGADVVVTYDARGGYDHPDHIQAHRITCAALAGLAPASRPDLYAVVTPHSWAVADRRWLATSGVPDRTWTLPDPGGPFPPSVVDDGEVPYAVVDPTLVPLQEQALRAHRTQVSVGTGRYALSNLVAARLAGREGFVPMDPETGEMGRGPEPRHRLLPRWSADA